MKHPTDPAQLTPWLRTPRTARDMARAAYSIERYRRAQHWLHVAIWFAAFAGLGVLLAVRG